MTRTPRTQEPRVRITTWPGTVLDVPPVRSGDSAYLDDAGWVFYASNGWPPSSVRDQLAIQDLQDLDTSEPEAVLAFIRLHGMISQSADAVGLHWGADHHGDRPKKTPSEAACHWTDIAAYLATAKVLARHVIYHLAGEEPMVAWKELGFAHADRSLPNDDEIAWSFFEEIDKGLRAFRARVEIEWLALGDKVGREITTGIDEIGLFSALCLQVLNLLTEGLPARRCANEKCGAWFVRQQGRAERGQYRTEGVIYCSKLCAKAKAQREFRRRKHDEIDGC